MKELLKIIIRVLDIFLFIFFIDFIPSSIIDLGKYIINNKNYNISNILISVLAIFFGIIALIVILIVIWKLSDTIAGFIVGKDSSITINISNNNELLLIFLVMIGIFYLFITFPNLIKDIITIYIHKNDADFYNKIFQKKIIDIIDHAITLLLSLFLIIKRYWIIKKINNNNII